MTHPATRIPATDILPRRGDAMTGPARTLPSPRHDIVVGTAVQDVVGTAVQGALGVAASFARWSVDRFLPDGGQRTARRNAWVAMGVEARLARDRREAETALNRAAMRAASRAAHPSRGADAALPRTVSPTHLVTATLHLGAPAGAEAVSSV
jgi:hypothetical protein